MKKIITTLFLAVCLALPLFAQYSGGKRGHIAIPDLKGYVTLKCDFHMHTVFSDGKVWPMIRVMEANFLGLDAIAITDHIEYRPYAADMGISHNRSYEIAEEAAKGTDIIVIKGAEITRDMPPGHNNAIFLSNVDELDTPEWMDAFRAAKAQNAFIFWNHPSWATQQPDTTLWWPEHTLLLQQGMMHGIEVVNSRRYCPESHRWCLEKKLTMLGNSDSHLPKDMDYFCGTPRVMTLVFAKERTAEAIREALNERRTAVCQNETVIGEEKYLKELFENALDISVTKITETVAHIKFINKSDLTFRLKKTGNDANLWVDFRTFTIYPHSEFIFWVRLSNGVTGGDIHICVENFLVQPNQGMNYTVRIEK